MSDFNSDLNRLAAAAEANRQTIAQQAAQIADLTAQLKVANDALAAQAAAVAAAADKIAPPAEQPKGHFEDQG